MITSTTTTRGGINVLQMEMEGSPATTGLIILHGRGHSMRKFLDGHRQFWESIVSPTLTLLFIDMRNHGDRLLTEEQNRFSPTHQEDMYSMCIGSANDASFLAEICPLYSKLERFGILGFSMGGHSALLAICHPSIKFIISLVGSADYEKLMNSRNLPVSGPLQKLVRKHDLLYNQEKWAGKKILLINGGLDSLVPRMVNSELEKLDCVSVRIDEAAAHEFSEQMKVYIVDWLLANIS